MNNKRIAHLFLYQVGEVATRIYSTIGDEVGASGNLLVDAKKDGLHHILYVDESEVLMFVAYGKVEMLFDAFGHQKVVFLSRAIYSGGTDKDVWKVADTLKIPFGFALAESVGGIGFHLVVFFYRLVVGFMDSSEDAQCADIDELAW